MRKYNQFEDDFIRKNYKLIPMKRISKILGRPESSARQRLKILGLVVPPEITAKFKQMSHFDKGHSPVNKGKKQTEFMSPEAIERSKKGLFTKGHLPHNTKESDLVISIRADKRGVKYKFIRVSLAKWIPLARYNWEQVHGPIAKWMKMIHKDGDSLNCDLSNLELLTPGELMKRNSLHNYPKEIANAIQLGGALKRKINRKIKSLNEKQD